MRRPSDNIPGIRGIGAKTAAGLLSGGLPLEDLHASGRLEGRGQAVTALWEQILTWRSMIRMHTDLPLLAALRLAHWPRQDGRPADQVHVIGVDLREWLRRGLDGEPEVIRER